MSFFEFLLSSVFFLFFFFFFLQKVGGKKRILSFCPEDFVQNTISCTNRAQGKQTVPNILSTPVL